MPRDDFSHVTHWVFDLDNTLYPPRVRLFDQIEQRMTAWVMRELGVGRDLADRLRHDYWARYGTTLAGLMQEHGVDPAPYLTDVHDIDFGALTPDPDLRARIAALPGRRIVYTNGCAPYAERVLAGRGLSGLFDGSTALNMQAFCPSRNARPSRRSLPPTGYPRNAPRCSRTTRGTLRHRTTWGCARFMSLRWPRRHSTFTIIPTTCPISSGGLAPDRPRQFAALRHPASFRRPCADPIRDFCEQETAMTRTSTALPHGRHDVSSTSAGHDSDARDVRTFWLTLVVALALIALAFAQWGLVALTLVAVACVPVIFGGLLLISVGR